MIQETGVILHKNRFRSEIFSLTLALPKIAASAKPGQFVHLLLSSVPNTLLRRPFSIAEVQEGNLRLIIKIIGPGTTVLSEWKEGTECDVIGPLGHGFTYDELKVAYLVGGGIGVAPLLMLQDELKRACKDVHFFLGAKTHGEFPLTNEEVNSRKIIPCSDDGSFGDKGFVSSIFQSQLKSRIIPDARVFSCGPVAMMAETDRICREYGLSHQVSLENRMACGVGVCQGCALKLKKNQDRGGYRLVCHDGPVFNAADIDWSLLKNTW